MQAVILAGGQGTRLRPYTDEHPKPMIPVQNVPFLEHLIKQLHRWKIRNIVLLLGYRAEEIQGYFKDGSEFDVNIEYVVTPVEFDTGARIHAARELLDAVFLLMYCDNYCPIDFEEAYSQFVNSDSLIQITAYTNKDGYTKNNLMHIDRTVVSYDKRRQKPGLNAVDIGYAFIKKKALQYLPDENNNFEALVYPKLVDEKKLGCFVTEHRYYSVGSWERMALTEEFFRPKKVVFLDRDGTLNVRPPKACYIEHEDDFRWLPMAKEAIKKLKDDNYQIYVVTNQPGIARGMLSWERLEAIHEKMRSDLRAIGADIDGIYICPHGWDEGCDCRKPKPGMLYQAQREHSLDLTECILIGDDERDIMAGKEAGLKKEILVSDEYRLWDVVANFG